MDDILEIMDETLTKVQKRFHAYVVERKIRKLEKKVERNITYITDWIEMKLRTSHLSLQKYQVSLLV